MGVAAGHSGGLAILFGVLFGLVYLPAIHLGERHLSAIMMGYSAYAARVLRWLIGAAWQMARAIWLP